MDDVSQKEKLWNKNFLLLWQGQLVSSIGDVVYEIALGFWVLAVTGSPALMGSLMAATTIPRILLAPLGGVIVDRRDRKFLIVSMDLMRGIAVGFVGLGALLGILEIWMVFIAGIVIGLGAALFNPAIGSVLPDIVPRNRLIKANSAFSIIHAGSGLLGNALGGFIYALLGAPLLFCINSLSYLFSAFTETFIKVPQLPKIEKRIHILSDLKTGFFYAWQNKGLRYLLISGGVINFFASLGFILFLPLFQQSPTLGPERYGLFMASLTLGMLGGMGLLAGIKIPEEKRFPVFAFSAIFMCITWALIPIINIFPLMMLLAALGGLLNAIINIFIQTVIQLSVPQNMRGKVFGMIDTLFQGLTPIAMAFGGLLGEFLPIPWVIFFSFSVLVLVMFPLLGSSSFKKFIIQKEQPGAIQTPREEASQLEGVMLGSENLEVPSIPSGTD